MKLKRLILVLLLALASFGLPVAAVFAFPGVPYDGQATATGIDVDMVVSGATVVITYVSQTTNIAGAVSTPVATNGLGNGLDVAVVAGSLPGVGVDVFWFSVKWTLGLKKERMLQLRSHLIFLPK